MPLFFALALGSFQSYSALTRVPVNMTQLTGVVLVWPSSVAPTWGLFTYGQAVSRTTYVNLYNKLCPVLGVVTISNATPGVVTLASHGINTGERIQFTTAGALPTGLSTATDYFVTVLTSSTFKVSTTYANLVAGTFVATSSAGSGIHSVQAFPHGSGNGTTTFNLPDIRGRVIAGGDAMGGTAASILGNLPNNSAGSNNVGAGAALGTSGGKENHVQQLAEMAAHTHTGTTDNESTQFYRLFDKSPSANSFVGADTLTLDGGDNTFNFTHTFTTASTGSSSATTLVQPTIVLNYVIVY